MKDQLDASSEYKEKLEEYEMTRQFLTEVFGLNQTLKMHVIKEHYKTYFKMTGKTLKEVSIEYHEAVHHSHENHEKKGGFTKRKGWAVPLIKREANQALSSLMFCMLDLQRKAICN